MRRHPRIARFIAVLGLFGGATGIWSGSVAAAGNHSPHVPPPTWSAIYVSNTAPADAPPIDADAPDVPGAGLGAGPSSTGLLPHVDPKGCATAPYSTIGAAVTAASPGGVIVVCPGVYNEDVVIPAGKPLTIEGIGKPIIDAAGCNNGVQVLASDTTIEGLTVAYANGEGILVGDEPGQDYAASQCSASAGPSAPASPVPTATPNGVKIIGNTVMDNDQGNPTGLPVSSSSYVECNAAHGVPGDCGEGIHLLSTTNSTISGNDVTADSGGILLTDENGPTAGNEISSNDVVANAYDCGITIAGHNAGIPSAFGPYGPTAFSTISPSAGGIYDNTVSGNVITGNGVLAQGAGVLLATAAPGEAVDNNTVEGNWISGNGLGGITLHGHPVEISPADIIFGAATGQNLNGNVVQNNTIGVNNLTPDKDFDFPPLNWYDGNTTGVIAEATSPTTITITGNRISADYYGIWLSPAITATTTPPNSFVGVTVPVYVHP